MPETLYGFLFEAAVRITGSLDIEKGLQELVSLFQGHIPADSIVMHVLERKCKSIRILSRADLGGARRLDSVVPLDPTSYETINWEGGTQARIINDTAQDPIAVLLAEHSDLFQDFDECSHIVMRFTIDEGRVGEVGLQADGSDRYDAKHVELFRSLASPLSSALINYLRHEELKQVTVQLED